jgi:hypothetical protein
MDPRSHALRSAHQITSLITTINLIKTEGAKIALRNRWEVILMTWNA